MRLADERLCAGLGGCGGGGEEARPPATRGRPGDRDTEPRGNGRWWRGRGLSNGRCVNRKLSCRCGLPQQTSKRRHSRPSERHVRVHSSKSTAAPESVSPSLYERPGRDSKWRTGQITVRPRVRSALDQAPVLRMMSLKPHSSSRIQRPSFIVLLNTRERTITHTRPRTHALY